MWYERAINEGTCKLLFLAKVKHEFPWKVAYTRFHSCQQVYQNWVYHSSHFPMELMATNAHA